MCRESLRDSSNKLSSLDRWLAYDVILKSGPLYFMRVFSIEVTCRCTQSYFINIANILISSGVNSAEKLDLSTITFGIYDSFVSGSSPHTVPNTKSSGRSSSSFISAISIL